MNRSGQLAAIGCALLAMATAGCGSSGGSTAAGVLQGRLVSIGGPAVSATPQTRAHPNPDQQIDLRQNGKLVRSTETRPDGSFEFTLHPGAYDVQSSDGCTGSVTVVIEADKTVDVALSCQVP